jgi:hypothetical protein
MLSFPLTKGGTMTKVPAQARQSAVTANLLAEQRAWKSTGSTMTIIPQTCIFKVANLASKTNHP